MQVLAEELQTGDVIRLAPDALTFTIEAARLDQIKGVDCVLLTGQRQDGWPQNLVLVPGLRVEVIEAFACNPDEAAYADLAEGSDDAPST